MSPFTTVEADSEQEALTFAAETLAQEFVAEPVVEETEELKIVNEPSLEQLVKVPLEMKTILRESHTRPETQFSELTSMIKNHST